MGGNLRKRILKNFEWEVTANKILIEIEKI